MTHQTVLKITGSVVTDRIIDLLQKAGFVVFHSFNLRAALAAGISYNCPIHPKDCDCNLAVLLVYGAGLQPATLILQSHDGCTWLSLVDTSEDRPSIEFSSQIKSALAVPLVKNETAVIE